MIIKNYGTGNLSVINELGKLENILPEGDSSVAYSASRFETVLEEPLKFFDRFEEAFEAGLRNSIPPQS